MRDLSKVRIIVPLVAPFDDNFGLNLDMVQPMADAAIENGADALAIGGTLSEFYALDHGERVALIESCVKAVQGRVPVIAGTGGLGTREAVMLTRAAESAGADVAMVVTPFYCLPTQEELIHHYMLVAESTKLPIMLYNIPHWSGVNIEPATLAELMRIDNIIAIKDEIGSIATQNSDYHLMAPPVRKQFFFYCGSDNAFLPYMVQGGAGGFTSLLTAPQAREMLDRFSQGDNHGAMELHYRIYEFLKVFTINGRRNPIPLCKCAFELYGLPVGKPRPPMLPATEAEVRIVAQRMKQFGVPVRNVPN